MKNVKRGRNQENKTGLLVQARKMAAIAAKCESMSKDKEREDEKELVEAAITSNTGRQFFRK